MSNRTPERTWGAATPSRALILAAGLVFAIAGCSTAAATQAPTEPASPSPSAAASAAVSASPLGSPTASPTASPTPTKAPTQAPTATPLPALAIGLCTGAQLSLTITSWQNDGSSSYAHVTAKNVSSGSCNMRGKPRAQIVDGGGNTIADSGSSSATVTTGDPVYTLNPNGQINDIFTWGNWCKTAPSQNVKVAAVMPFSLGRIVAPANGAPTIPSCYASGSGTTVSAEAWLP